MQKAIFLALTLLGTQVHAAAAINCTLPPDTAVIESTVTDLTLSANGKEVVQTTDLWPAETRLMVDSDTVAANGDRVIAGHVQPVQQLACAQVCSSSTFTLTIAAVTNGITPNGKLVILTTGFDEAKGPFSSTAKSDFVCQ